MKKLTLALVCAFAVANVDAAAVETKSAKDLNLSKEQENVVLAWAKKNPVLAGTLAAAGAAALVGGASWYFNNGKAGDEANLAAKVWGYYDSAWKTVSDNKVVNHVAANKMVYGIGTLIVAGLLAYDLTAEKSQVKELYNKLVGCEKDCQTQTAPAAR